VLFHTVVLPSAVSSLARGIAISIRPNVPISDRDRWPWRWPVILSGPIGILGISLWLAAIARARKHHLELGFDRCLDEAANLVAQSGFNRIKPVVEEGGPSSRLPTAGPAASCYHCSWRSLHRRANAGSFGFQSETTPHSIPTKPRTAPSRLAARWCG
jgi:hypothetical protein